MVCIKHYNFYRNNFCNSFYKHSKYGKKIQYDKLHEVKQALSSFLFSFHCKNYMRPSARINCLITRYIQEYIDKNTRKYVQNTQIKSGIDEICLFISFIIKAIENDIQDYFKVFTSNLYFVQLQSVIKIPTQKKRSIKQFLKSYVQKHSVFCLFH